MMDMKLARRTFILLLATTLSNIFLASFKTAKTPLPTGSHKTRRSAPSFLLVPAPCLNAARTASEVMALIFLTKTSLWTESLACGCQLPSIVPRVTSMKMRKKMTKRLLPPLTATPVAVRRSALPYKFIAMIGSSADEARVNAYPDTHDTENKRH